MGRKVLSPAKIELDQGEGWIIVKVDEEIAINAKAIGQIPLEKAIFIHASPCGSEMRVQPMSKTRTAVFCPLCGCRRVPSTKVATIGDFERYLAERR